MANTRARSSSWSDMPRELLEHIAGRLGTRPDICNFRAVCEHWKYSVPLSPLHRSKPLLHPLLPRTFLQKKIWKKLTDQSSVVVVPFSVYLLRPVSDPTCTPWLVCVEEVNRGKFSLRQPLCRSFCWRLPNEVPKSLDLSRFEVSALFKSYDIGVLVGRLGRLLFVEKRLSIIKVVMYVNPARASGSNPSIDDCTVIVLHGRGFLLGLRLKEGNSSPAIRAPGNLHRTSFDDVVSFRGGVYAVDRKGKVYSIDYTTLKMDYFVNSSLPQGAYTSGFMKLIESAGELFLVRKCQYMNYTDDKIKIYKLDLERRAWKRMNTLGDDRILFMSCDGCFFGSIRDFPGWRGDCVVSCQCSFSRYRTCYTVPGYYGALSRSNMLISVYYFRKHAAENGLVRCYAGSKMITSYPLCYSSVFWPPPPWLSL